MSQRNAHARSPIPACQYGLTACAQTLTFCLIAAQVGVLDPAVSEQLEMNVRRDCRHG